MDTGDGHEIYYEVCGGDNAIPAVFIHGGPGAPPRWAHRQLFDHDLYRAVFYHQRGCGMSTPYLSLENNTIDAQVEDLHRLKEHLGIDEPWVVVGNSWGTALGQIYAIRYPDDVRHLVLAAVTFADQEDAQAFLEPGFASRIYPERFKYYAERIPEDELDQGFAQAYYKRVFSDDPEVSMDAVQGFSLWNFSLLVLNMDKKAMEKARRKPEAFEALTKLFFHYYQNEYSKSGRAHIWPYLDILRQLPVTLVHGRYDIIAPTENAYQLHNELPGSRLLIVPSNAHYSLEGPFSRKMIDVLDDIALMPLPERVQGHSGGV